MNRLLLILMSAALLGVFPTKSAEAADDVLPMRRIGMQKVDNSLLLSFSYRDAFTAPIRTKLSSGLTTSVVLQLSVERKGEKQALAFWARTVEVTYDLWEERFVVLREDDTGRKRAMVGSAKEAIDLAAVLTQVAVGPIPKMIPGLYRVRVKIETNPISKEMVDKIRSWLARTRAKKTGSMATTNYFGSFVGALVDRRISEAEHTIEFVSQWFRLRGQ